MKKLLVIVTVCAMIFSFAACGKEEAAPVVTEAPATAAPEAAPVPDGAVITTEQQSSELLDPTSLNMGNSGNPDHAGDTWYKEGSSDECIYFEKADNSDSGLACVQLQGGAVSKIWLCKATADNHLIDQEAAEGKSEIDIVFTDIFTAVNNVNGSKYVRGSKDSITQLFAGKKLIEQENNANTLIFNADGTGKEVFDGKEYDLKWELDSASTLSFVDGENEFSLTIALDENGSFVNLYDRNLRTYVPAA